MHPYVIIVLFFPLVCIETAEWCVNSFDAPGATKPSSDFVSCEEEVKKGTSACWKFKSSWSLGLRTGCAKACTRCAPSGGDTCNEVQWPDKDNGIVCGECKVLVTKMKSKYRTCGRYCESLGRTCTGAWEEWEDTCVVKHEMTCDHRIRSSDAICECNPGQPSSSRTSLSSIGRTASVGSALPQPQQEMRGQATKKTETAEKARHPRTADLVHDTRPTNDDDGSPTAVVISVVVGSCLVLCLLLVSMYMFFKWKQTAKTLHTLEVRTVSVMSANNVVVGNPVAVTGDAGGEEKGAAAQEGIVMGNPVTSS